MTKDEIEKRIEIANAKKRAVKVKYKDNTEDTFSTVSKQVSWKGQLQGIGSGVVDIDLEQISSIEVYE